MKWGKRRAQKLKAKRDDMIEKRQVGTTKYARIANKAYVIDRKMKLQEAKKNNDTVKIQNYKYDIKKAKHARKYGTYMLDGNQFKSMYKVKSTSREGSAINLAVNNSIAGKERANRTLRKVGGLAISAAMTAPMWVPAVKEGKRFLSSVDLKTIRYDFVKQQFTGINRR